MIGANTSPLLRPHNFVNTQIWSPIQLGSTVLKGHYDASDSRTITIATGVSQWDDKSGNANHLTQGAGSAQPVYTTGEKVTFDGTNDELKTTNTIINSDVSIFIVRKSSENQNVLYYPNSALAFVAAINDADTSTTLQLSAGTPSYFVNGTAMANPNRDDLHTNYNTGSKTLIGITGMNTTTNWGAGIAFGLFGATSVWADAADYHEIIIAIGIDTATRQKIEGYLAWKWGLEASLPIGHPYLNNPPTLGQ